MLESAEKLNNQAILYASNGNFDDAIACFKRALVMEKKNYLLWFNLGLTYRDSGNFDEAISAVKQAARLNPDDPDVIQTLAFLFYTIGQNNVAMRYCMHAVEINHDNPEIWNLLGVIQFKDALYQEAEMSFENAVTLNPYFPEALFNLRDTYEELGNKNGAAECERRMAQLKK